MATRSRRSAGGAESALNPTMIQLYDTGRLKKELELRGLPTQGSKQILADRLFDFVVGPYTTEAPKPQVTSPAAVKGGRKRNVSSSQCSSQDALLHVKEEPDDENSKGSETVVTQEVATEPAKGSKRKIIKTEVVDDAMETPSITAESVSPAKSPKKRKIRTGSPKVASSPATSVVEVMPKRLKLQTKEIKSEIPDEMPAKKNKVEDDDSSDDDMPLLSKLSPRPKEKRSNRSHGTRSKVAASIVPKPVDVVSYDCELFTTGAESPTQSRPQSPVVTSDLVKGDTDWKPSIDAVEVKPKILKERKVTAPEKQKAPEKRPSMNDKRQQKAGKPITTAWAEKYAELRRSSSSQQELSVIIKTEPEEVQKSSLSPASRKPFEEKRPSSSGVQQKPKQTGADLLGSILGGQSQLLNERRRKQEEMEREDAAIAEKKKALLDRMEESARVPTAFLLPPPPPPPKRRPLKEPVPVELTLPPPPPPPKKKPSQGMVTGKPSVPPPPPPPKPCKMDGAGEGVGRISTEDQVVESPRSIKREAEELIPSNSNDEVPVVKTEILTKMPDSFQEVEDSTNNDIPMVNESSVGDGANRAISAGSPMNKSESEPVIAEVEASGENLEMDHAIPLPLKQAEINDDVVVDTQVASSSNDVGFEEEYDPLEASSLTVDNLEDSYIPSVIEKDDYARDSDDSDDESDEDEAETEMETGKQLEKDDRSEEPRASAGRDRESVSDAVVDNADLIRRANAVLQSLSNPKTENGDAGPQYTQMPLTEDFEYEPEETEKPQPEYHGEPVPSDDDDYLFQMAAGLAKPKKKREIVIEEEKLPSDETIEPDYYNADLHIKGATEKNWIIEPENADGLALMWGGVRSNYGVKLPFRDVRNAPVGDDDEVHTSNLDDTKNVNSRILTFQIKITDHLAMKHLPFEEADPYDIRVGFSFRYSPNIIGEHPNSYCFTALGKKASNNLFNDFGEPFGVNDVITACFDLDVGSVRFWKNDIDLGIAFQNIKLGDGDAVYPHICTKNCVVSVNFGTFPGGEKEWKVNESWRFPSTLGRGDLERSIKAPESKSGCTVLMMVGLPGVGKTTWVRQYLRDHPNEQWTVIQAETILAAMRMNGVSRQRAHQGRWDMVMGLVGKVLQRNVLLAARRRRNYILDMCNSSRDMRKKRLQLFEEFSRKCLVIIPSDEEMLNRQAKQARSEGTGMIPPEAILEMKAMVSIPAPEQEPIEDVQFIEPPIHRIQDAIEIVAKYNEEGRPWFQKRYRRRRQGGYQPYIPAEPPRKAAPVTVLPPLKISITDTPTQSSEVHRSGSFGSTPGSVSSTTSYVDQSQQHFSFDHPQEFSGSPASTNAPHSSASNLGGGSLSAPYKSIVPPVTMGSSIVGNSPTTYYSGTDMPSASSGHPISFVQSLNVVSDGIYGASTQYDSNVFQPRYEQSSHIQPVDNMYATPNQQPPQPPVLAGSSLNEEEVELSAEEMQELRDTTRSNTNQNPIVQEAFLRAKMRALQVKKKEKLQSKPNFITVVSSRVITAAEVESNGSTSAANGSLNVTFDNSPGHSVGNSPAARGQPISYHGTPTSQSAIQPQQLSINVPTVMGTMDFSTPPPMVPGAQQSPSMPFVGCPPMNVPPPGVPPMISPAPLSTSIPPPLPGMIPIIGVPQVTSSSWNSHSR